MEVIEDHAHNALAEPPFGAIGWRVTTSAP
jgi:hypothetical protein